MDNREDVQEPKATGFSHRDRTKRSFSFGILTIRGQKWDFEMKKAVREVKFFVVLLSQNSVSKKGDAQKEFKLAMDSLEEIPEGQIYLIPIKADDCYVPSHFVGFQWVDLKGAGAYD